MKEEGEILLVEDDPNHAELILIALKEGHVPSQAHVARDGEEALEYLFSHERRIKLILLDLKLDKLGGLEVLGRVRSDERTRYIPVVVLTSSQNQRDIEMSYRLGANSYVVKPLEFEKFAKTLAQVGAYWMLFNQPPIAKEKSMEV